MTLVFFGMGIIFGLLCIIGAIFAVIDFFEKSSQISKQVISITGVLIAICGVILLYAEITEIFVAYYGGNKYELESFFIRYLGPYRLYKFIELGGLVASQLLWFPKIRNLSIVMLIICLVNAVPYLFMLL